MSWSLVDDDFLKHPKTVRAIRKGGPAVIHTWLAFRLYCGKNLTDGLVPVDMVDEIGGPKDPEVLRSTIEVLVEVNLFERPSETHFMMHDYLDWAPSRAEVLERKASAKQRKDDWKRRKGQRVPQDAGPPPEEPDGGTRSTAGHGTRSSPVTGTRSGTRSERVAEHDPDAVPNASPRARAGARARAGGLQSNPIQSTPIQSDAADPSGQVAPALPPAGPAQRRQHELLPMSLDAALDLALEDRARVCTENPTHAEWIVPQHWPEVGEVASAFAAVTKRAKPRLGAYAQDSGLRAVVGRFADGWSVEALCGAIANIPTDPLFQSRSRPPGLADLSPEVVRRLADGHQRREGQVIPKGTSRPVQSGGSMRFLKGAQER